jgi:hypothetical protein
MLNKLSLGLAYLYVIIIFIKSDFKVGFDELLGTILFFIWVSGPAFISSLYVYKAPNYPTKRFFMAVQIVGFILSAYIYYNTKDAFAALSVPFVQYVTLSLLGVISGIITKIANRDKKLL